MAKRDPEQPDLEVQEAPIPSIADFDPEAHADLPPAFDPEHKPEPPTLAPARDGENRQTMLLRVIARLPGSCNFDMSNGEIFGRCLERLKTHGVTDDELAWAIPYIRKATDVHTQKRDAAAKKRADRFTAAKSRSIDEQLEA